ncbi:MAG: nucleoside hydrolase, partial [bacterium]
MPLKVLLDTDIGSDIDDAVALSYLLKKPNCNLLGVTTVTGDAVNRARLVKTLCEAAG